MYRTANRNRMLGLAVSTAMAGALLTGCTTVGVGKANLAGSPAPSEQTAGKPRQALNKAEAAVKADPRNAVYRAELGNAYLDLGRFQSAETSFNDALTLGDNSPRTALSLAVALIGEGNHGAAARLLSQWEDRIPAADVGLAMALAGQPERGIVVMSNAIRSGQNDAKVRQNLAYAYALAGRWREARLMASQDLHGDVLDARIEQFAQMVQPEAWQTRIATLLGVPAGVRDGGQPIELALATAPADVQLAQAPVPAAPPAPAPVGELPAIALAQADAAAPAQLAATPAVELPAPAAMQLAAAPVAVPAAVETAPAPALEKTFANAFLAPAPSPVSVAALTQDTNRFAPPRARAVKSAPATQGGHLVQLGSFTSEQRARQAWSLYARKYPELAGHQMVISEAIVRGKHYWRVSAGGYGKAASASMCGKVRSSGAGCFAYAEGRPLPGAVDTGIRLASR